MPIPSVFWVGRGRSGGVLQCPAQLGALCTPQAPTFPEGEIADPGGFFWHQPMSPQGKGDGEGVVQVIKAALFSPFSLHLFFKKCFLILT